MVSDSHSMEGNQQTY